MDVKSIKRNFVGEKANDMILKAENQDPSVSDEGIGPEGNAVEKKSGVGGTEKKIKVSVIVPCYNTENYLEQCLRSILEQTLEKIEVIIVDDGSTDGSVKIMEDLAASDERVHIIHKPNSGYGNSMNRGIAAAKGEYIGIVESDDYIVPEMYETLYSMTEGGTVDVARGIFWDCYDNDDGTTKKVVNTERQAMPDVNESFTIHEYPQILMGHPSIWTGIYRREFLLKNDIYFKELKGGAWVDNPFFYDTLCCAKKIRWVRQPLYCYRKTNPASSSKGYDLAMPFKRIEDCMKVIEKDQSGDETTLEYLYRRAILYLNGELTETFYPYNRDYARPFMQDTLRKMNPDVITDRFNVWDQRTFFKYRSKMDTLMPSAGKILIYNWISFDNPERKDVETSVYCSDLIESILRFRPDVEVYFISSGCVYDIKSEKCYFRTLPNKFGDRVRSFEIVNSPIPSYLDMIYRNPEPAYESEELKNVFADFIEKNGPFRAIHFNSISGLSFDVFDLKRDFPDTKFIFTMHDYSPICMESSYYQKNNGCCCNPDHKPEDCSACFDRDNIVNPRTNIVDRGKIGIANPEQYSYDNWARKFDWDRLCVEKDGKVLYEFTEKAKAALNSNMDLILAESDRVRDIVTENGINPDKVKTSYIGNKEADFQIRKSSAEQGKYFKLACLITSSENYEKEGYSFFVDSLEEMDEETASGVNLILSAGPDDDENLKKRLENFHSVKFIHDFGHGDLPDILRDVNLGVIPALNEEGMPHIAVEMVSFGVPILTSSAGGASELCDSEKFCFESGNTKDLLRKLIYIIKNPSVTEEYWDHHKGLVTRKEHFDEMSKYYDLPEPQKAELDIEEYSDLLAENDFLYQHFEGGRREVEREYNVKSNQMKRQAEMVGILLKNNGIGHLMSVTDIHEYLRILAKNRKKYLILIAVKDTPGFALNKAVQSELENIGIKENLIDKHWHSYVAVVDGRKLIYEELSVDEEPVKFEARLCGVHIVMDSRSFHKGNLACIKVDGYDYAVNSRGLNIVCFDKSKGAVVDSVCFDTHEGLVCSRF